MTAGSCCELMLGISVGYFPTLIPLRAGCDSERFVRLLTADNPMAYRRPVAHVPREVVLVNG